MAPPGAKETTEMKSAPACTPFQGVLCVFTLLCYGVVGFAGSVSGKVIDTNDPNGWARFVILMAMGRCIGALVAGLAMIRGERRKRRRLEAAERSSALVAPSRAPCCYRMACCQSIQTQLPHPERMPGPSSLTVGMPLPPVAVEMVERAITEDRIQAVESTGSSGSVVPSDESETRSPRIVHPAPSLFDLMALVFSTGFGIAGYIPFFYLSAIGDVSAIAPLMVLHSLAPMAYGFWTGEEAGWNKLLGIATSFGAVLLLGFDNTLSSSAEGGDSSGGDDKIWLKLLLLLASQVMWGITDLFAILFGRRLRHKHVIVSQLAGVSVVGVIAASTIVFNSLASDSPPASTPATPADAPGVLAGVAPISAAMLIVGGNCAAALGWLAYVRLGQTGDASRFAPIIQLYGLVSAVFGLLLLNESAGPLKISGMAVALVAVLALGVSRAQADHACFRACGTCLPCGKRHLASVKAHAQPVQQLKSDLDSKSITSRTDAVFAPTIPREGDSGTPKAAAAVLLISEAPDQDMSVLRSRVPPSGGEPSMIPRQGSSSTGQSGTYLSSNPEDDHPPPLSEVGVSMVARATSGSLVNAEPGMASLGRSAASLAAELFGEDG
jgi:drug/metabolite transporter (DMT)-like permease